MLAELPDDLADYKGFAPYRDRIVAWLRPTRRNHDRPTPFDDLDEFLALPRVAGLAVSPDGSRAVTTVGELNAKRTEYVTAVWELDVAGEQPARRLTRGAKGESSPVFTASGDLLFVATRDVPGADGTDEPTASLWRLPAAGGEAVAILDLAGGVDAVHAARAADVTLVTASLMPSATDVADDERLRALRKDTKVSAVLHTGYPVRHWDHDIGPAEPHLRRRGRPRGTLTPAARRRACARRTSTVSADGRFAVASWAVPGPGASLRHVLVRVDVATGERTTIADDPVADLGAPGDLARRLGGGVRPGVALDARDGTTNHAVPHDVRRRRSPRWPPTGTDGRPRSRGPRTAPRWSSPPTTRAAARCSSSTPPTRR